MGKHYGQTIIRDVLKMKEDRIILVIVINIFAAVVVPCCKSCVFSF